MNNKYVFLFKDNNGDERDCVYYVNLNDLKSDLMGRLTLHGACFTSSLDKSINYEDITTILTKEEFEKLCNPNAYDLSDIVDKLTSVENDNLFNIVIEQEKEYIMSKYSISKADVDYIFNEYGLEYRDRGIIGYIYDDTYDLGYEEAFSLGYINNNSFLERYFDFEKFGEDLLEDDYYLELSDGRCVYLHY